MLLVTDTPVHSSNKFYVFRVISFHLFYNQESIGLRKGGGLGLELNFYNSFLFPYTCILCVNASITSFTYVFLVQKREWRLTYVALSVFSSDYFFLNWELSIDCRIIHGIFNVHITYFYYIIIYYLLLFIFNHNYYIYLIYIRENIFI